MDQTPVDVASEEVSQTSTAPRSPGDLRESVSREVGAFLRTPERDYATNLAYAIAALENALHELYCLRLRRRQ